MGSLKDIGVIFERYRAMLLRRPRGRILHLNCGNGKITFEYVAKFFTESNTIVGVDTSDELIHAARDSHLKDSVHYTVLDILQESEVTSFLDCWGKFDKVVCFSCNNWIRNPLKAITNMKRLMKEGAECFFAFVGYSPVYNTYQGLSLNLKWTEYMQGYDKYVPEFHRFKEPESGFQTIITLADFAILHCEGMEIAIFRPTDETLNSHIIDVMPFIREIPKSQKSDFISDCREKLLSLHEGKHLHYKIVVLLAKNSPVAPGTKPENSSDYTDGIAQETRNDETDFSTEGASSEKVASPETEVSSEKAASPETEVPSEKDERPVEETDPSRQGVPSEKVERPVEETDPSRQGVPSEKVERPGEETDPSTGGVPSGKS